jgi:hypothetical protein
MEILVLLFLSSGEEIFDVCRIIRISVSVFLKWQKRAFLSVCCRVVLCLRSGFSLGVEGEEESAFFCVEKYCHELWFWFSQNRRSACSALMGTLSLRRRALCTEEWNESECMISTFVVSRAASIPFLLTAFLDAIVSEAKSKCRRDYEKEESLNRKLIAMATASAVLTFADSRFVFHLRWTSF